MTIRHEKGNGELRSLCRTGKKRFRTERAAMNALELAQARKSEGQRRRREQRVYECLTQYGCGGWHLTSAALITEPQRTPIPHRSKRTEKTYRDSRRPLVARLLVERPDCEIRWDENCTGQSSEVDEICGRGRGGSILDETNLQTACHHCHAMKTANPAEAELRGLAQSSADYRQQRDAS